ncbi:MAG TPA: PsiF family protein [Steroidobacteraceae bacterium]|nr:PsiF family protein [Steroidobacteraceae bacterium]
MTIKAVIAALALVAVGTALAAEAPAAPSAVPVKHPTLKSCNREATAKKLAGKERERFVKECLANKAAPAPPH